MSEGSSKTPFGGRDLLEEFQTLLEIQFLLFDVPDMFDKIIKEGMIDEKGFKHVIEICYFYSVIKHYEDYICCLKTYLINASELGYYDYLHGLTICQQVMKKKIISYYL
jgi:hypothetical protein